jgi:RNA polymerase sigma-70 factor, ECF subfamily
VKAFQRGQRDASAADELLERVAGGDRHAFTTLYDVVAPTVYGMARRVLRDEAQAEEVTQEVLVEVWRTAGRYDRQRGSAMAWVTTLAHRRAVDRVRSEEARRRAVERVQPACAPDEALDAVADEVVAHVVADVDRGRVQQALDRLSAIQRQSVELAFFDGNTHAEIAAALELPLGTVKTRIRDGLLRLRQMLEEAE